MTSAHINVLGALALLILLIWIVGSRARRSGATLTRPGQRIATSALVVLSLIALFAVVSGFFLPGPHGGEGVAAHIFQLAVAGVVLVGALFFSTREWREGGLRIVRPLSVPAVLLAMAFGMLYYLEHYYR